MNFALLVGKNDPLSGYFYEYLEKLKLYPSAIIIDKKELSSKDSYIIQQRVGDLLYTNPIEKLNITSEIFIVDNHNNLETINIINNLNIDFMINAGTPRIIKKELINHLKIGILNAHPGILPYYRGCSCVEWSILNNHPVGVTVHLMDHAIDEGNIIEKRVVDVTKCKTYQEIRTEVYKSSFELISIVSKKICENEISKDTFLQQYEGKYWEPMNSTREKEVIKLVENKKYKYLFKINMNNINVDNVLSESIKLQ